MILFIPNIKPYKNDLPPKVGLNNQLIKVQIFHGYSTIVVYREKNRLDVEQCKLL